MVPAILYDDLKSVLHSSSRSREEQGSLNRRSSVLRLRKHYYYINKYDTYFSPRDTGKHDYIKKQVKAATHVIPLVRVIWDILCGCYINRIVFMFLLWQQMKVTGMKGETIQCVVFSTQFIYNRSNSIIKQDGSFFYLGDGAVSAAIL